MPDACTEVNIPDDLGITLGIKMKDVTRKESDGQIGDPGASDADNRSLADLGGVPGAYHSYGGPILSFLHTFSAKSIHFGGPCPLTGPSPPTVNPGSATGIGARFQYAAR